MVVGCGRSGSKFQNEHLDLGCFRILSGIEPRRTELLNESWVWDEAAQSYRPDNVQFCQESRVLVRDIDHFCPWTGTTIAGGNIRYFYAFIIGLFVQIFVLMGVFLAGNSAKTWHNRDV